MKHIGYAFFAIVAVLLGVVFSGIPAPTETKVTIKKIEESALEVLIQADNNLLVVTFMAAWCSPCIDELPVLNKLYKKYENQGLKLVGISIDLEGPEAMQPIVNKLNINFPMYWYGENAVSKYKLNAIPMLFFIRQGEIVERLYGKRSEKFLDKKIQEFLK